MWQRAKDAARRWLSDGDDGGSCACDGPETWHVGAGDHQLCTWTVRLRHDRSAAGAPARCGVMASLWEGERLVAAVRGQTRDEALRNLQAIRNPAVRIAGASLQVVRG